MEDKKYLKMLIDKGFFSNEQKKELESIIPELAESDDERIRKELINFILYRAGRVLLDKETEHRFVAYLNRQKEQKPAEKSEDIHNRGYVKGVEDAYNNVNEAKVILKKLEKENPKPIAVKGKEYMRGVLDGKCLVLGHPEKYDLYECTEWSKEDEKMRELLIAIFEVNHPNGFFKANEINTTDMCGVHTEEIIYWLKSLHPQKLDVSKLENFDPVDVLNRIKTEWPMAWEKVVGKQEWDEEDEIELNDAIKYVQNYGETSSNEYTRLRTKEIVEWLKSIHHPVKDKEMKLKILKYLSTSCSSLEFEEVEEYLNNLHPSWKPSEEQMEALDDTIFFDKTVFRKKKLVSLLEDLKKLI